jgi:hypothetical protein
MSVRFGDGGRERIAGKLQPLCLLEFDAARFANADLLNRFHLAFQPGKFGSGCGIAFDEEQGRPKQDDADTCGNSIASGLAILNACNLSGP